MGRVLDLDPAAMPPDQHRLYEEIKGPRAGFGGPFALWIRLPKIADLANRFGNALRLEGKLDRGLFELMILAIARYWGAQYEWYVHESAARKNGIADALIFAIRDGLPPVYARDEERVIVELTRELQATRTVSQATYDRALAAFGLDVLIEIITVAGFYTTAAMMINTFQSNVPGAAQPLPSLTAEAAR